MIAVVGAMIQPARIADIARICTYADQVPIAGKAIDILQAEGRNQLET